MYGEDNWKNWKNAIVDSGLKQYDSGHEGYTFFIGIYFDNLIGNEDSLGLSITLPASPSKSLPDATGFGFLWDTPTLSYIPFSYFYDGRTA